MTSAQFGADAQFDAGAEFDRQVRNLLAKRYPELANVSRQQFEGLLTPLREVAVAHGSPLAPPTPERAPFVLVVRKELVPADLAMPMTALHGRHKPGFADFDPEDIARFEPIKELRIPDTPAYLVFDVERGEETLNVTPDNAMPAITARGRVPLTVEEGIGFITHFPESLEKNHCFSLAGSRCGDRRVPALWISKGAPKLGWCWAGNPHTWLGSASCRDRVGLG